MGRVDELKNRLFRQEEHFEERVGDPRLDPAEVQKSPHTWADAPQDEIQAFWLRKRQRRRRAFIWGISITLVLVLAGAGAAFYFLQNVGRVNTKNVDLEIIAPERITAGDRIAYEGRFKNNNQTVLESVELTFDYPEGALPIFGSPPKGKFRDRRDIGRLNIGEERTERFEAYLLGKEGTKLTAKASLEYRPSNSSARFGNDADLSTLVDRSPIGVSIEFPDEINVGQEVVLEARYVSTAETVFKNISLNLEYPEGFEFVASDPAPQKNNNTWNLGDLSPGQSGTITVRGVLNGTANDHKNIDAKIGIFNSEVNTWTIYGDAQKIVLLRAPLLSIDAFVNNSKDHVAAPGESVSVTFAWKNNLKVTVTDVTIEAELAGRIFDYGSVKVQQGVMDGATRKVVWNGFSSPALKFVEPGKSGTVSFTVKLLSDLPIADANDRNFTASVSGRIATNVIPQGYEGIDISGKSSVTFKTTTRLGIAARGYYYTSLLPNSGPLPPQVGEETTYMITLSLSNLSNDVENVVVTTGLPSYVKWKETVNPPDAAIRYNANTGEIAWDVGLLEAGTGRVRPAREVSFQVGIIPGPNLVGTSPDLTGKIVVNGRDTFTGQSLQGLASKITTAVHTDLRVLPNQYSVAP